MNDALISFTVFQGVFFFLDIYIHIKTNRDIARKGEYLFFSTLIIVHMVYLCLHSIWSLGEYEVLHLSRQVTMALCTGSLLSVSGSAFVFFYFTVEKTRFLPLQRKLWQMLCLIPEIASAVMILVSPWTKWIFTLDEANNIVHSPAYPVMLVSSSLYLVGVAGIAIHNMRTAKTTVKRRSGSALLLSVLILILFVVFDAGLEKASILPAAIFAVIIVIFISMQESNINSDALTGMNNRRKADDYMTGALSEVSPERPLILYMGDMNGFKSINDIYGHLEGDEALVMCGDVLKRTIGRYNGFAARFGGDEFLMSWRMNPENPREPDELIREINERLAEITKEMKKPYSLSMSIGYAVCGDRNESLSACIRRADDMLYQQKQAFYRSRNE